jgi:hypothetical protein
MLAQRNAPIADESYEAGFERLLASRLGPGLLARIQARLRWSSLDRQLIEGADPARSPALAARAASLASSRARSELAAALKHVVDVAHGKQKRWWAVVRHEPVRANASMLNELAELLRGDEPLYARGIAIVSQLTTDGCGPIYTGSAERLAQRLHEAREEMVGGAD